MLQRIWNDMKLKAAIAAYQKEEQQHDQDACIASGEIRLTKMQLDRDLDVLTKTPRTPQNMATMRGVATECVLLERKLHNARQRQETAMHKAMQARAMVEHLTRQRGAGQSKPATPQPPEVTAEELLATHATQSALDDAFVLLQQADAAAPMTPEDRREVEDLLSGYTSSQAYLPPKDATRG